MEIKALYKKFLKHKGISVPKNKVQNKKSIAISKSGLWDKNKNKVIVPSNRITMKGPNGEPNYFDSPIMGIGVQSGEKKVMYPGKEYSFPNDRSVYERKMQSGGYRDNAQVNVVNPYNLTGNPIPSFLKSIKPKSPSVTDQISDSFLNIADIGTDVMQVGNFIPYAPAQVVGKAGNILGSSIDAIQAKKEYDKGNNVGAAINAGSAILPSLYNPKYKRSISSINPKNSPTTSGTYTHLDYLKSSHKSNPVLRNAVNRNRGIAVGLVGETAYDINPFLPKPSKAPSVMKESYSTQHSGYQDNLRPNVPTRPYWYSIDQWDKRVEENKKKSMQKGGLKKSYLKTKRFK